MLLKISMSVEKANEAAKSATLKQSIESTMQALKPEAAYFYPEDGKRTAIMVFDMTGSWQLWRPAPGPFRRGLACRKELALH